MKTTLKVSFFLIFFLFVKSNVCGQNLDQELLNSLKIEANHNLKRLKSLKEEKKNNKIYENEREKSLGQYLEEQENWELIRERGLADYKKRKKTLSPAEDGPEYREELDFRRRTVEKYEKSRDVQVRTRNQVLNQNPGVVAKLEDEELGLLEMRPRYELRKRGRNKWVKGGSNSGRSSGGAGSFGGDSDSIFPPPPPPPMDYIPAPPPLDSYEDVPPPPPPSGYDFGGASAMPYDSGYGDVPPPPPPPPVDYDF